MTQYQYSRVVTQGTVSEETGHFFKAAPFTLQVSGQEYTVSFERGEKGEVGYVVSRAKTPLTTLVHPDYVPDCAFEALEEMFQDPHLPTVFIALTQLGISIHPAYKKHAEAAVPDQITYRVNQLALIR